MVRFAPIEERGESTDDPLSATLLLRPTIDHPDLSKILGDDTHQVMHLKMIRDEDAKPVDALHVHGYAPREDTRPIEDAIWSELRVPHPLPEALGTLNGSARSEPLAITQLMLLFHLLQARYR